MTIDMKKQYRTRDGREVRILMTDGGDWQWPVIAAYKDHDGNWWPLHCTKDGRVTGSHSGDPRDLIEVPPRIKRKVWVNVYERGFGDTHTSRESADECSSGRIACVEIDIDVEEGHGL